MQIISTLKKNIITMAMMLAILNPVSAMAKVTLQAKTGDTTIVGELVDFKDGVYTLKTFLGDIEIPADTVTCTGIECPNLNAGNNAVIVFAGSDTIGDELMPLMLSGYAASVGGILEEVIQQDGKTIYNLIAEDGYGDTVAKFAVDATDSGDAFKALMKDGNFIGMSTRKIRRNEELKLIRNGAGPITSLEQEHIIGVDSIVVVVNPGNPISALTTRQISRIYKGDITNWKQIGGRDMKIVVYSRPMESGTRSRFDTAILGARDVIQVGRIAGSNVDMATKVNASPGAIGFVGFAFQRGTKALNLIMECGIAVSGKTFSAKTEEYPLQRRLYLYNRTDRLLETSENFLDYAISENVDSLVAKAGYVDLGVERVSQMESIAAVQGLLAQEMPALETNVLRELIITMLQKDRLSTTFRFASGGNRLGRKSQIDLERLINYLEKQPKGTKITLVGFTDSDGPFSANYNLSIRRAEQVLGNIQAFSQGRLRHIVFNSVGFSELDPAACNTSLEGKRINRRVEVWMQN